MKTVVYLMVIWFTACCLFGCTVDSDFKRPASLNPKSYTKEKDRLNAEQHIALGKQLEAEWWSLFACKKLNRVIHQAMADNYDIVAAEQVLAEAQEAVRSARGSLWPQIALEGITGNQKYGVALFGPANFKIPPFSYYELGPTASWTIDLSGSIRYNIQRQKALAQYQAQKLEAVYLILTGNVVGQAVEIASLKAEIAATQRIIQVDEKILALTQTRFKAGSGTKVDILTVKSRLEHDRAFLPPLKQRLNSAHHALAILMGKAPADWTPPDFNINHFRLPKELPLCLPSELAKKRPDILAAEANLKATRAAVGMAEANFYPKLVISANMLQEALTPQALFNGASNTWSVAAGLTAPLFTGGMLRAEKRKAEHACQASLARYQQTILVAFGQIADALTALKQDAEAIAIARRAVKTAAGSLKFAEKSYEVGTIGLLQVQDAQHNLASAEVDLIRIQRQRYLDTIQLFVALGGSPRAKQIDVPACP